MPDDDAVYRAVIDALRHLPVDYVEEPGEPQALPDLPCPRCHRTGAVVYTHSDVLEGSLEHYHLVHTEVDHHLRCAACGGVWTVYKLL
ncbi:MAG: hypothetical protein KC656_04065 [Myxococcales bacterium]|nr:hypothetical protein [Myxococcales bacterium]MCB9694670.1 hypothetical protein [Alphaproteobacteria bacterium]